MMMSYQCHIIAGQNWVRFEISKYRDHFQLLIQLKIDVFICMSTIKYLILLKESLSSGLPALELSV